MLCTFPECHCKQTIGNVYNFIKSTSVFMPRIIDYKESKWCCNGNAVYYFIYLFPQPFFGVSNYCMSQKQLPVLYSESLCKWVSTSWTSFSLLSWYVIGEPGPLIFLYSLFSSVSAHYNIPLLYTICCGIRTE